jgi:glycosyltransferase involved in cell wall biosynthesis
MRVLHVYKDYPPVIGGIENHLRLLAEHQARRGLDVTVLVTSRGPATTESRENGVRVIRAARWGEILSTPVSPRLVSWLPRLPADMTHLHFPYPLADVGHLLFGRARATVVTYHSDIVRQRIAGWAYRPLVARLLDRADRVIATSPAYRESSPALRRVREKCAIVPMGVETAAWAARPGVDEIRRRFPGPIVLFVGRLRYYKGLEYLIEAMQDVPATLLVGGDGRLRARLEAQARASRASGRVTFLGDVPQDRLASYYAAADVVVLPSSQRSEAYGMVLVEAMACGTPVISTELATGTSFVNRSGETGLVVPPRDPRALAEAIRSCLGDPAALRRMGDEGRRRVRAEFEAGTMVDRVLSVYEEALAGARSAARIAVAANGTGDSASGDGHGPRTHVDTSAPPAIPSLATVPASGPALAPLDRAVLLAVLYSDLFEYPLTEAELRSGLVGETAAHADLESALARLVGTYLERRDGLVFWKGRERLIGLRRARAANSPPRWDAARRYARWLGRVPFVRMVAVCGSQAMENAGPDGDVDFFVITAPRRLWIVQVAAMLLRRALGRKGAPLCPNYLLAADALEVKERNLYSAHETVQVVPLCGREAYEAFRRANEWVADFLPGFDGHDRLRLLADDGLSKASRLEGVLGGPLGDLADRLLHRALLAYYAVRLRGYGFGTPAVRAAYRRDRQVVVGGGYARAVAAAFRRRVAERLPPGAVPDAEVDRLFPPSLAVEDEGGVDRLYGRLLAESYGVTRG